MKQAALSIAEQRAQEFQAELENGKHPFQPGWAPLEFEGNKVFITLGIPRDNVFVTTIWDHITGNTAELVTDSMEVLKLLTDRGCRHAVNHMVTEIMGCAAHGDSANPVSESVFHLCSMDLDGDLKSFYETIRFIRIMTRDDRFRWEVRMIKK